MKGELVLLVALGALVAVAVGFPAVEELAEDEVRFGEETGDVEILNGEKSLEEGVRVRRATCDLLSVSTSIVSLNHAACAAHCLAMRKGYRGGRCKSGVCHCRR